MSAYHYFDVKIKLREGQPVELNPRFFKGCILKSLETFFGEIGGKTKLDIVRFSVEQRRAVFRVPAQFSRRTHTALSLISDYQKVPCHFQVLETSTSPLDFEKGYSGGEETEEYQS